MIDDKTTLKNLVLDIYITFKELTELSDISIEFIWTVYGNTQYMAWVSSAFCA